MSKNFQRLVFLSGCSFYFSLCLIFLPLVLLSGLSVENKWVESVATYISSIGTWMLFAVVMMPGLFVIFQLPWYAQAWLRGSNPLLFSEKSWVLLTTKEKSSIFFTSLFFFFAAIFGVVLYMIGLFGWNK